MGVSGVHSILLALLGRTLEFESQKQDETKAPAE